MIVDRWHLDMRDHTHPNTRTIVDKFRLRFLTENGSNAFPHRICIEIIEHRRIQYAYLISIRVILESWPPLFRRSAPDVSHNHVDFDNVHKSVPGLSQGKVIQVLRTSRQAKCFRGS